MVCLQVHSTILDTVLILQSETQRYGAFIIAQLIQTFVKWKRPWYKLSKYLIVHKFVWANSSGQF